MKAWKVIGRCLLVLLCVVLVIAIVGIAQFFHRSDPKNVKRYDTDNPFITGETAISAHRSGAGDYPEETLAAFRGCVENPDFAVDYFEFEYPDDRMSNQRISSRGSIHQEAFLAIYFAGLTRRIGMERERERSRPRDQ